MRSLSVSVSIRTSPTADSSSVCDTLGPHFGVLDDALDGDDLVATDDERPRLALGAGDLGVDEHVLDLLPPAGETVAGVESRRARRGADQLRDRRRQRTALLQRPKQVLLGRRVKPA